MNIRLSKCSISEEEIAAVSSVLNAEYLGMGKDVVEFELAIKAFLDTEMSIVCVNSGTAALHVALLALGIGAGDSVLVPSLTYVATFQAISATGAVPIACEVDIKTLFIDVKDAEAKLQPNTKAILPVHYASSPKGIEKVYEFANRKGLRVIEDAAQSFGSMDEGFLVGTRGDIVCFSFDGIKNITCGEGGALLSNDPEVILRAKDIRLLGVEKDSDMRAQGQRSWEFDVKHQGFRYHMSNINAAIGVHQLQQISQFRTRRQKVAEQYVAGLVNLPQVEILNFNFKQIMPHIFVILADRRDALRTFLLECGIECGIHYKPNHLLSFYKNGSVLPLTESLYARVLTLPCHVDLTETEVETVCQKLRDFYA